MPFEIGQIVSDYQILDILGKGGMGRVYRVVNVISGRMEAMKVLLGDFAGEREISERFGSEIRTLGRLDHPNIAKLHTAFRAENEVVMLMEFVEGFTLTDRMKQGPIPLNEVLSYVSQTLAALDYAHQNGVVHRDIKPSNIMVTPQGTVKLMDFGIAKSMKDNMQTRTGMTMGSLCYMSPEQVRGTPVDARSDLYAMGMVLYELTAGRRPFEFESTYALLDAQLNSTPCPPIELNPSLPPALNGIIMKALEKDPAQRFQSASEFRQSIEEVAGPGQPSGGSANLPTQLYAPVPHPAPPQDPSTRPSPGKFGNKWLLPSIIVMCLLVAAALYLVVTKKNGESATVAATGNTSPAITPSAPPAQLHLASGDMVLVMGGDAHLGEHRSPKALKSFYIDKTEVPLSVYRQFCRERSIDPPQGTAGMSPDMPAVNVSFYEASQFAQWAGKRLPSGDEWEMAARGLNGLTYPWGDTFQPGRANLRIGGAGHVMPVDSYVNGASPAGALNMVGNVWELVATECAAPTGEQFEQYRMKEFSSLVPRLLPTDLFYQARGGSFRTDIPAAQLSSLVWDYTPFPARARQPDVGFRCARDADH